MTNILQSPNNENQNAVLMANDVSKKYCKSLKRSMAYGITDIARNIFGMSSKPGVLRKDEFWAVDGVSFQLKKGEVLGIIGPNGSGKTTLLKMLNGIFWPDRGKITIKGRVGALIEVGAGFHPLLTGRENIYINGAIMGMSKTEIDSKFDSIVAFADIGDFLDSPVKNYSSGMFVRLGFAIAVHCEPDVLLIDEILAVGDMDFRRKCYNKIESIKEKSAIILVSHNMFQIGRICSQVLFLHRSVPRFYGPTEEAISRYYDTIQDSNTKDNKEIKVEGPIRLQNFNYHLAGNRELKLHFTIDKDADYNDTPYILSVTFVDMNDQIFAHVNSLFNERVFKQEKNITCTLPNLNFNNGKYKLNLMIYDQEHARYFSMYRNIASVTVQKNYIAGADIHFDDATWSAN